jgi:hypothetical protein
LIGSEFTRTSLVMSNQPFERTRVTIFGEPGGGSMIRINQLCFSVAHPLAVAFLAAWMSTSYTAWAQTSDVPPLEQTTECMFKVLQTMPDVSEPKLGITTSEGWTHPFLEYRAAEALSGVTPIRFIAKKADRGGYWFLAVKSGLGAPEFHVTDAVIRKWKAQCIADATVLFP